MALTDAELVAIETMVEELNIIKEKIDAIKTMIETEISGEDDNPDDEEHQEVIANLEAAMTCIDDCKSNLQLSV